MTEPIDLAEARRNMKREHDNMCQMRRELIWSVPITDHRITMLDMQLMQHPLTDLSLLYEIYSRIMYVTAATYAVEATPPEKRQMLLRLREMFRELCQASERVQEVLMPLWSDWAQVLKEEEQQLERYGYA
jgi:hypothetical protein